MKQKIKKYAIGSVIGAGMQFGDMIGQPIRTKAEEIDPYTGEYVNKNKAVQNAWAGSFWSPIKAATAEGATTGERIAGALGFGAAFQKRRYDRLEEENKRQAFLARHPNTYSSPDNPYYMAKGGNIFDSLIPAELEDGEVYRTPDGNIEEVKGKTHAQGGEMYAMPDGTQILGKNTSEEYGEQFKVIGQRLKDMHDKHTKVMKSNQPMIAKTTSKRMLDNIQSEYDKLMTEQEQAKILEDTIGVYAKGGEIYIKPSHRGRFTKWAKKHNMSVSEAASKVMGNKDRYSSAVVKMANFANNRKSWKHAKGDILRPELLQPMTGIQSSPIQNVPFEEARKQPFPYTSTYPKNIPEKSSFMENAGNIASGIAEFAPIAYNISQGLRKEPKFNYQSYLNPYISDIRESMRNRRYNIDPELEANKIAQAVYNRNLRSAGVSPSVLQGGLQAGATSRMRSDAAARAQQQNINNQYLGQQAEMDYNLGRDISALKTTGYDINLRNQAAQRNMLGTGLSQLQQLAQTKKLEQNQIYRDAQRMGLLKDLFSDFSYTDQGWLFNQDGSYKSDAQVMKYLKGKRR